MDSLPPLDPVTRLSPNIIRILGGNPGNFTLQGTNTYLIGRGPRRILIDTGEGRDAWKTHLAATLKSENATLDTVLLTHWHHDHVGGVADVRELVPGVRIHKHRADEDSWGEIEDGEVFGTEEGVELRAVFSPGHTGDHMAFVLKTKTETRDGEGEGGDDGAMFTGDNVLGHGTAVFEDLGVYMRSLERMREEFGEAGTARRRAYPGHGEVVEDGRAKVVEYIAHRRQRETDVVNAMLGPSPRGETEEEGGWGSMEIVKVVYKNYPERLHAPAEGGVRLILAKLEGDGRVRRDGERWSLVEKANKSTL